MMHIEPDDSLLAEVRSEATSLDRKLNVLTDEEWEELTQRVQKHLKRAMEKRGYQFARTVYLNWAADVHDRARDVLRDAASEENRAAVDSGKPFIAIRYSLLLALLKTMEQSPK